MRKTDFFSFSNGGLFSSKGTWQHSERMIDSYELIIVTKGNLFMEYDGKKYSLSTGECLIIAPGKLHRGYKPSNMSVEFYWLHFYPEETKGVRIPPGFHEMPAVFSLKNASTVIHTVRQLLHCSKTATYPYETCHHLAYILFSELIHQLKEETSQNLLAAQVHEYIRSHADIVLSAHDVAEHFSYNADYLSRILKKYLGYTLNQDISRQRLNHAKLLLQTSNYTIEQIAHELGYSDPNLFIKFFCYHAKTSPTAYRSSFSRLHTNHK
ncbi:MAG: AraC family transcriptional regulator [Clostridia bacterium]|nr:AraC family transcriptional regulator [Clostridia bacterium]